MPKIEIDYIPQADGEPLLLLPEKAKVQLRASLDAARSIAENDGTADTTWNAVAAANGAALSHDADARKAHAREIRRAVFAYKRPTLGDKTTLQRELSGITDPDERIAVTMEAAYRILSPEAVSGWDGEIPYALDLMIAESCASAFFPSITEELAFFIARSPGNTSGAPAA